MRACAFSRAKPAGTVTLKTQFGSQDRVQQLTTRSTGLTAVARRSALVVRTEAAPAKSVSLVLLAGGVGKRMGASMPKQYLPLLGKPIALYSLETMSAMPEFKEVVVVCDPSYKDIFQGKSSLPMKFALPGSERQDSVFNGLSEIDSDSSLVCIHDSARPLVTVEEVQTVLSDATEVGAAVLGVQCKATVKEATDDGMVVKTLDRSKLWEMHTPQVIKPQLLKDGFKLVAEKGLEVTDDVSIVEHLGLPVRITKGSYENLKVTTPEDLLIAERLLAERADALMENEKKMMANLPDPLEEYCTEDPSADECRVYED